MTKLHHLSQIPDKYYNFMTWSLYSQGRMSFSWTNKQNCIQLRKEVVEQHCRGKNKKMIENGKHTRAQAHTTQHVRAVVLKKESSLLTKRYMVAKSKNCRKHVAAEGRSKDERRDQQSLWHGKSLAWNHQCWLLQFTPTMKRWERSWQFNRLLIRQLK